MSANNAVVVILPGVVVAVGALVVFLVDLFVARKAVLAWIAAAGLIAGAAVAVGQWISVSNGLHFNRREPQTGFAGMVSLDKYTLFCVVLFAGIGVATIMLSDAYLARRKAARGEFYGLLMLVITGMIGMVVSTDIVAFFVSFEFMSLPTYVLAGTCGATSAPARRRSSTSLPAPFRRPSSPLAWRWSTAPQGRPPTPASPPVSASCRASTRAAS